MNDRGRMRPPRRQKITAIEAEALVASGRRIDQIIWSEFLGQEWAEVQHGDCIPERGEVLIADLLRLGLAANPYGQPTRNEAWTLRWNESRGRWHGSGFSLNTGGTWWSEHVTYRPISTGWGWLRGQQNDA